MKIRETKDVLNDIKNLVRKKGFVYTLCLIIVDDFHYNPEEIHEINNRLRLSRNEVSLIIGFLIQDQINFDHPSDPFDLIKLKKETYKLMEDLQESTMKPIINKFKSVINNPDLKPSKLEFFGGEDVLIEPIFYAGDGIYDFQHLEFLKQKYKYDENWLISNTNYYFDKVISITKQIKAIHQKKIQRVNFIGLKDNKAKIVKQLKKDNSVPKYNRNQKIAEFLKYLEFYQFNELFDTETLINKGLNPSQIGEHGWKSFYNALIDLFTISRSDFHVNLDINSFLNNFSIQSCNKKTNSQFQSMGDFNLFNAKPIIQLDFERFFVPITFSLFEAVYESPYYWMQNDTKYKDSLADNRGKVGEEITYNLLIKIFGSNRTFKSIKIETKKGFDKTDVDVLCILGSKALCVQVKSKKLTQLSRSGNFKQLQTDFKGAIQDAYDQGIICRKSILSKNAIFYDEKRRKIKLPEEIDEVYIMGVTTENYPSLTHQTFAFLEKNENEPNPLFLTIFDLELVLFYLNNPYDFLYYVRQRIDLLEYYHGNEEIQYLGYHLVNKLWKDPKIDHVQLDLSIGQLIDRNYYPYKLGIETSSENDKIKNRWKNTDFEKLCNQIDELKSAKKTDIIFHLMDWSEESRDNLMSQIINTKLKTKIDGQYHNFIIQAGPNKSTFGATFYSWNNNNIQELDERLLYHCKARKYKSQADYWIGIGSLMDSDRFVDIIVYNNMPWEYDYEFEQEIEYLFKGENQGIYLKTGRKIGRNEPCNCGSGKKYKKCCGRL